MPLSDPLLLERLLMIVGASFAACLVVVLTQNWHGKHSLDHDLNGAQKLHAKPVPRVGGLGLIVGLLMAGLAGYVTHGNSYPTTLTLLVCALPVFLAGFVEDLTKRVSVRTRLLSSFISAALAVWLLGAQLTDVDVPGLDALMRFSIVGVLLAPRRFVWKPTATIGGGRSAVWACGQVAERLVHMPMRPCSA